MRSSGRSRATARPDRRPSGAAGFSLAEVVFALGLLAGVLIAAAGILVLGNRQVTRGRSGSEALAAARDVLEEMKSWSFQRVTRSFAADCSSSPDPASCDVDGSTSATAAAWQQQVREALGDTARIELSLESLDGAALDSARAVRITVRVIWSDGQREREMPLAMVRM